MKSNKQNDGILGVLSYPPFLFFLLSVFFSQIAINTMNLVLIFLVFFLLKSNFSVSLLILTFIIPQIFLSFVGGIVADLRDKKSLLFWGNIARSAIIFILFYLYNKAPFVYLASLLVSVVTQFYIPAETPIIPYLVKKRYLASANSLFGIALFGSILISYVFAGPLVNILGRAGVFIFLSILFLLAAVCVYVIPDIQTNNNHRSQNGGIRYGLYFTDLSRVIKKEFFNTLSSIRNTAQVADALFFLVFSQIIILILATVVPGYAKSVLDVPAEDLSLLLFFPAAAGTITSALLLGHFHKKINFNKIISLGVFLAGIVLFLLPLNSKIESKSLIILINSFLPSLIKITFLHLTVVLSFLAGVANALIFVPTQTIIQEKTPEFIRSKTYGLVFSLVGVFSLIPVLAVGGIADLIGVGNVLLGTGAIIVFVGLLRHFIHKF